MVSPIPVRQVDFHSWIDGLQSLFVEFQIISVPGTKSGVSMSHVDGCSSGWHVQTLNIKMDRHKLIVNADLLSGGSSWIGNGVFECENRLQIVISLCGGKTSTQA